jgi:hypothetical protein
MVAPAHNPTAKKVQEFRGVNIEGFGCTCEALSDKRSGRSAESIIHRLTGLALKNMELGFPVAARPLQ